MAVRASKKEFKMNNLDQCLTQLADILRAIGVEELMISEDGQHHIVNNEVAADKVLQEHFCSHVQQLYSEISQHKD